MGSVKEMPECFGCFDPTSKNCGSCEAADRCLKVVAKENLDDIVQRVERIERILRGH